MAELRFSGRVASGGFAAGPLAVLFNAAGGARGAGEPAAEAQALRNAIASALGQLLDLAARAESDGADILAFQIAMLEDETLAEAAFSAIEVGATADRAWRTALDDRDTRVRVVRGRTFQGAFERLARHTRSGARGPFRRSDGQPPSLGRDPRGRRPDAFAFSRHGLERRGRNRLDARQRLRSCRHSRASAGSAHDRRPRLRSRRRRPSNRSAHRQRKRDALSRSGACDPRGFRGARASGETLAKRRGSVPDAARGHRRRDADRSLRKHRRSRRSRTLDPPVATGSVWCAPSSCSTKDCRTRRRNIASIDGSPNGRPASR